MKTIFWAVVLLMNFAAIAAFGTALLDSRVPATAQIISVAFVAVFLTKSSLLVAARLNRTPSWAKTVMKVLCCGVPLLWLAGSFDHGMVSGLEVISVLFVALFGLASWRAFLMFAPTPYIAANTDASHPLP